MVHQLLVTSFAAHRRPPVAAWKQQQSVEHRQSASVLPQSSRQCRARPALSGLSTNCMSDNRSFVTGLGRLHCSHFCPATQHRHPHASTGAYVPASSNGSVLGHVRVIGYSSLTLTRYKCKEFRVAGSEYDRLFGLVVEIDPYDRIAGRPSSVRDKCSVELDVAVVLRKREFTVPGRQLSKTVVGRNKHHCLCRKIVGFWPLTIVVVHASRNGNI